MSGVNINDLHADVLKLVASKMSTREWAAASRACLSWAGLQPESLDLRPISMRELRWGIRHWQEARSVKLDLDMLDLNSQELSELLARGAQRLGRLEQLQLGAFGEGGDLRALRASVQAMLASVAGSIQALALAMQRAVQVQQLAALKHLALSLGAAAASKAGLLALQGLQGLRALQTLSVEVHCGQLDSVEAPALDFTASRHLRAVNLHDVVPEGLVLPPACSLSLSGEWASINEHAGRLCQCATAVRMTDADRRHWLSLAGRGHSGVFRPAFHSLKTLRIQATDPNLWTSGQCLLTLDSCVGALEEVALQCPGTLALSVTAPLALCMFTAVASVGLSLSISHPSALAARLSWLCLCTSLPQSSENVVSCPADLVAALAARDVHLITRTGRESQVFFPRQAAWPHGHWGPKRYCCNCGACADCLKAAGILR